MNLNRTAVVALALVTFAASVEGATIYPANNGFEVNNLGSGNGAYEYGTVPSWNIVAGNPGEAANGSAFNVTGADNGNHGGVVSDVGQAALFQGGDGTLAGKAITQSVTLAAGTASVHFLAENRASGTEDEQVNVYLDGSLIGSNYQPGTGSFTAESTVPVVVTAGAHILGFAGLQGSVGQDTTVFIDSVSISNVPEPASFVLFGLSAIGLFLAAGRRRSV